MTIDEICDLLARELPVDYTVKITLENGCGSVDVEQFRGPDYEIDEDDRKYGTMEEALLQALRVCKEHAEKNP